MWQPLKSCSFIKKNFITKFATGYSSANGMIKNFANNFETAKKCFPDHFYPNRSDHCFPFQIPHWFIALVKTDVLSEYRWYLYEQPLKIFHLLSGRQSAGVHSRLLAAARWWEEEPARKSPFPFFASFSCHPMIVVTISFFGSFFHNFRILLILSHTDLRSTFQRKPYLKLTFGFWN